MSAELDIDDVVGSFGTPLAKRELAQLRADIKQYESLTPGGSEFCDSPSTVFTWLKDRLANVGHIAGERNQLRAELTTAQEAVDEAKKMAYLAYWQRDNTYRILGVFLGKVGGEK